MRAVERETWTGAVRSYAVQVFWAWTERMWSRDSRTGFRRFWPGIFGMVLLLATPAMAEIPEAVRKDGKLTVLYVDLGTPFLTRTDQDSQGFDHDVLQGFTKLEGLELETVAVEDVSGLIPGLLSGRGEVIAGALTWTEERSERVAFTSEVTPQRHVAVNLSPDEPVRSLEELRELRVGTVAGTSWETAARSAGIPTERLTTDLTSDQDSMIGALAEERVDAEVTGLFYALLMKRAESRVQLGTFLGEPGYHAYAVHPDHSSLRDALDGYLQEVRDTPGWYRIVVKHFGEDAPGVFRAAREGRAE